MHARDDMHYWRAKYEGLEERMKNLSASFQDAKNSLDLQKEKMMGMVPSHVHVTVKERYTKLLVELGKQTAANQRLRKKLAPAAAQRERAPDDWRNYAATFADDGGADVSQAVSPCPCPLCPRNCSVYRLLPFLAFASFLVEVCFECFLCETFKSTQLIFSSPLPLSPPASPSWPRLSGRCDAQGSAADARR